MITRRWSQAFISLAFLGIVSACAAKPPAPVAPPPPTDAAAQPTTVVTVPPPSATLAPVEIADPAGMPPDEVVKTFYTWYIDSWHVPNREHIAPDAYKQTGYLTEELIQEIDQAVEEMRKQGPGFDPILYAQDVPQHVRVEQTDVQGEQATVLLSSSFQGHLLEIGLQQIDGIWKISRIQRGSSPGEASSAGSASPDGSAMPQPSGASALLDAPEFANWRIYRNTIYGVQVAYPPDWIYEEVTADPNRPPIGAPDVQMIVFFHPQEWELNTPFNLELTEGSWEEYRASHIEPTESEALELNGYAAMFELEQITEEISILRYLIENPTDREWRVTFIDYVSGFPDRTQGNEVYVEQFQQMLQTFEFIR